MNICRVIQCKRAIPEHRYVCAEHFESIHWHDRVLYCRTIESSQKDCWQIANTALVKKCNEIQVRRIRNEILAQREDYDTHI